MCTCRSLRTYGDCYTFRATIAGYAGAGGDPGEGNVSGVYLVMKGKEGSIVVHCARNECSIAVLE